MRTISVFLLTMALAAANARAQTPFGITSAMANPQRADIVSVTFSDPLADAGPHTGEANVRIDGAPAIRATAVSLSALSPRMNVTVRLSAPVPVATKVQICFRRVAFLRDNREQTTNAEVCAPVSTEIGEIETAKAAALKVLTDTPPGPPDEKVLNASGFVTTASDDSEGGADLAFNPKFSDPNASVFFRLKKATADDGDARHLEAGVAYRAGMPWNRGQLRAMRAAQTAAEIQALLRARQSSLLAGTVINFAMKFEADPSSFDATNGVGEVDYEIVTATRSLGTGNGFWRGYVIPAGVEVGRRLAVDETGAATDVHDWIARYKAGAGFKVFFRRSEAAVVPLSRIDLSIDGIWRYLKNNETNFNQETKALDLTTDGGHGYVQAALRVFFLETGTGRFGIKASYSRGSLPPVFADVKSFQFGFLVESNDKD